MAGWGRTTLGAERLRAVVLAAYAVDLVALEPVAGGADAAARTWRGTDAAGGAWAVREAVGAAATGLAVAAAVAAPGIPLPRRTRAGALAVEAGGTLVSLVPWVEGPSALDTDPTPAQWASFGRLLAAVHATDPATVGAPLPRDDHRGDDVAGLVAAADSAAAEVVDALGREAAAVWSGARDRVGRVLDGVRRLGEAGGADLVLCHGDPHRGNLVLDPDGALTWLLDWDDVVLSWPERDLLMVVDGLPGFSTVSPEQLAWFEEGYGPVRADPARLAHHRCVRALEDVALFTVDALDPGRSDDERSWALGLVRHHLDGDGILALAEQSLASTS
ncbi:MAG: aminoglycoside phosphotransferase family protein [Candidatus Nanopelagicales bacterium]